MTLDFIKFIFVSIIALTIFSCKKGSKSETAANADIYIAGAFPGFAGGYNAVGYWKNGAPVTLADSISGLTNAIVVAGDNVYAAGYTVKSSDAYGISRNDSLNKELAVNGTYWHNGIASTVGPYTVCNAIAVSGNNVYVAGYAYTPRTNNNGGFIQNPSAANTTGMYWKNGTAVSLGANTTCTSIAVAGSDVYVAGAVNNIAAYWKNGVLTKLSGGNSGSIANAIALSGNDVYIAGTFNVTDTDINAVYWKNGVLTRLTTDASFANAIAINGTDVYIAGSIGSAAAYWKNGAIKVLQTPGIGPSSVRAIAVKNNTIFETGYFGLSAMYWQNGTPQQLSFSGAGYGIAVVPK